MPKRLRSKSYLSFEENEEHNGKMGFSCRSYGNGDFVWAKAFPYTWWPGQINGFEGPFVTVSFFGCNRTRSFHSSEIRGFEESFPKMLKMIGVKLSEVIGLALDEFAQCNVRGLKCSCAVSSVDNNLSLAVKNGFNSLEIFGFVNNKAVSPQISDAEIATVVRVSANLSAFRSALSIYKTSKVDETFCAENLLDLVVKKAINPCIDDKEIIGVDKAVTQMNAFRKFASVRLDGFYQLSWKFLNDNLEHYNVQGYLEQPDCPSEDDICQELSTYSEVDVSQNFEVLEVNSEHEDTEVCASNMTDINFLDMDECYTQEPSVDILNDWEQSAGIQHSCMKYATVKPEVGSFSCSVAQCSDDIPHEDPLEKTALHILAKDKLPSVAILHSCMKDASMKPEICAKVRHISSFSCMSSTCQCSNEVPQIASLGKTALQVHAKDWEQSTATLHSCTEDALVMPEVLNEVQSVRSVSCAIAQSSNVAPQTFPLERTALQIPSKRKLSDSTTANSLRQTSSSCSETISSSGTLMGENTEDASVMPLTDVQPVPSVSCAIAQSYNVVPQTLPLERTVLQIPAKRKISDSTTGNSFLQTSSSRSKTMQPSRTLMGENNPVQVKKNYNDKAFSPVLSCKLDYSTSTSSQHNHHDKFKWQAFYASPLIKDGLLSINNRLKKSLDQNNCSMPKKVLPLKFPMDKDKCGTPKKKITMKFPRDYTLPSKEDIERKFRVFGPLDHRKTNVFFYTGVGQVVFLHQSHAVKAYNYVTEKSIFGQANMRFWLTKTECTKNDSSPPRTVHSSSNVKTCLKKPSMPQLVDKRKNYRVSFLV